MSVVIARQKRTALYLSIAGLMIMVAAVSAVSARDPSGVSLRVGMIMMTIGAAMWLPWQALVPAALAIWIGPNYVYALIEGTVLFDTNMLLEGPGIILLAIFAGMARHSLHVLEAENLLLGANSEEGIDPETGVYEERLLIPALEAELVRSRRFGREFAFVLAGIDELRQRFDYRDEETLQSSIVATAQVLRSTRAHIDRVYRRGDNSFALILPESGEREVIGLVRRLRRVARRSKPAEGEPGGPLASHYGATFFPQCATTTEDLLRRAEIAMKLAEKTSSRLQLDGAEAPAMPAPETLRRPEPAPSLVAMARDGDAAVAAAEAQIAAAQAAKATAPPALHALPAPAPNLTLVTNGNGHSEHAAAQVEMPEQLDEAVADVLKRLDETLSMIRSLRSGAA
jgi:diguanylate cyclase (GGDEF)-like protein